MSSGNELSMNSPKQGEKKENTTFYFLFFLFSGDLSFVITQGEVDQVLHIMSVQVSVLPSDPNLFLSFSKEFKDTKKV